MRWLFLSSILLFCSLFLSFSFAKHHHDNNNNNNQPSTSPHLIGSLSHSAYPYELVRDTPFNVSYDSRSLLINNQRVLLQSGSLHYPRTTPDTFLSLLESFKAAGLNTVQIYIFWNYHELTPGVYDFYTESRNFTLLLDAAKQAGLFVNFRLGPYVCAEWHYGGLPVFLKDESGMVFRTNNDLWKAAMGNWVKKIMTMVEPWLARNGGPIILAQIENEYGNVEGPYGNAGKQYIQWSADFANSLQLDIPWIMCVQDDAPSSVIQTCNGFYCDQWIRGHVNRQPSQPNMWTEDWSGWFQTWGQGKPYRPPQDMAFAVARWIQLGGTFHNYYMFYGGTNFGRTSGGPWIITSYDYNAPLNEYGGRNEPKYSHSSALHHVIQQYAPTLLSVDSIPSTQSLGSNIEATVYGTLGQQGTIIFISNINTGDNINVNFQGHSFSIPGWSTSIIDGQSYNVLYNTATIKTIMIEDPLPSGSHSVSALNNNNNNNNQAQLKIWSINETIIGGGQATLSSTPIEQLLITEDLTDYVYHRIPITLSDQQINNGHITITLDHISDYFYIFIDSKQLYGSRNIGSATSINLSLSGFTSGTHTLSIVTITQGITNYGEFLETVKVGLLGGVSIDGQSFVPAPNGLQWSNEPYLKGETNQYYINNNLSPAWNEYYSPSIKQPWVWFKVFIPPPSSLVHPNGFGLDLSGLGKGSFYVNGHHGGRYWNIKASGNCPSTPDNCDYRGAYSDSKCRYGCGDYSQQYYRVPTAWIKETAMSGYVELVFFEEQGGDPNTIQWKAF